MASCVLYQNVSSTITVIDIPRSIELAQGCFPCPRRLLSSDPVQYPFPSLEPKSAKARSKLGEQPLGDLLTQRRLEFVLGELTQEYGREWCLPRLARCPHLRSTALAPGRKQNRAEALENHERDEGCLLKNAGSKRSETETEGEESLPNRDFYFHNPDHTGLSIQYGPGRAHIPPKSTVLCGDIMATRDTFLQRAPKFDLVIMDPPWPNRSARRKQGYGISYNASEISSLLLSIPLTPHLTDDGIVGVWITNKPIFRELALGLFDEWGLTLIEEWIWLKITANGEPICELDSLWRKPYEILLVGKRGVAGSGVKRKVLAGVPDLHSRKPNLKSLFEKMMGGEASKYEALEVFARNLTAGWWGWGDEVLKFQEDRSWIDENST